MTAILEANTSLVCAECGRVTGLVCVSCNSAICDKHCKEVNMTANIVVCVPCRSPKPKVLRTRLDEVHVPSFLEDADLLVEDDYSEESRP